MPYKPDSWNLTEDQDRQMRTEMQVQASNVERRYITIIIELKSAIREVYIHGFRHGVLSERKREKVK